MALENICQLWQQQKKLLLYQIISVDSMKSELTNISTITGTISDFDSVTNLIFEVSFRYEDFSNGIFLTN